MPNVNADLNPPPAPEMIVLPVTFQSFNFLITPSEGPGQCAGSYVISSTSSDGTVTNLTVQVTGDRGELVDSLLSGFNLCSDTYSFTVSAVTIAGVTGEASRVIRPMSFSNPSKSLTIIIYTIS